MKQQAGFCAKSSKGGLRPASSEIGKQAYIIDNKLQAIAKGNRK
jgi:hypothetical protein